MLGLLTPYSSQVSSLKTTLDDAFAELASLKSRLIQSENDRQAFADKLSHRESELAIKNKTCDSLRDDIDARDAAIVEMRGVSIAGLQKAKQDIESEKQRCKELEEINALLSQENHDLQLASKDALSKYEALSADYNELEKKFLCQEDANMNEIEADSLRFELATLQEDLTRTVDEKKVAICQLKALEKRLNSAEIKLRERDALTVKLQSEVSNFEENLRQRQSNIKEAELRFSKEVSNLRSELSLSESTVLDLRTANKTLEGIFEKQNVRISEISQDLSLSHKRRDSLEKKNAALETKLDESIRRAETLSSSAREMDEKLLSVSQDGSERLDTMRKEMEEVRSANQAQEEEIEKLRSNYASSDASLLRIREECEQLTSQLKEKKTLISKQERELLISQQVVDDLKVKLAKESERAESLDKRYHSLKAEKTAEVQALEDKSNDLVKKIDHLNSDLESCQSLLQKREAEFVSTLAGFRSCKSELDDAIDKIAANQLLVDIKTSEVARNLSDLEVATKKSDILAKENRHLNELVEDLKRSSESLSVELERYKKSELVFDRENSGLSGKISQYESQIKVSKQWLTIRVSQMRKTKLKRSFLR